MGGSIPMLGLVKLFVYCLNASAGVTVHVED